MRLRAYKVLIFVLILFSSSYADDSNSIVLNEVLANEPGGWVSLEWVELFNNSDWDVDLAGWKLISDDDTTVFSSVVISAKGYLVLARKLVSFPDSISFDGYWGDNSGIWGDSPEENFPAVEVKISLVNSCDSIELMDTLGNKQSFTWINDSGDKISWEKIDPLLGDSPGNWWICVDSSGSTPGKENSISVPYSQEVELKLKPNPFSPDGDGFEDELTIKYTLPLMSNLTLKVYDTKGRLIKTLMEEQPQVSGEIIWDGRDDKGRFLKIGIYIVYAHASGNTNSTAKVTFVVAKR